MVFSSIPLYLDPHNWHQQQNLQHGVGSTGNSQIPIQPPSSSQLNDGSSGVGSIRPGSMVDRARLAKIPQPEPGLNCPRCESTNTKFCYFNNYNLTQPRHFCKTCRRYWTRGGALRNVPVGGGCRKNKRSTKNNRTATSGATTVKSSPVTSSTPSNYNTEVIPANYSQLPIIPSLSNIGNGSNTAQFGASNLGLSFGSTQQESDLVFIQLGSNNNNSREANGTLMPEQWRNSQHFPFVTSFEPTNSSNMYHHMFQNDQRNVVEAHSMMKIEDQNQLGLNLTKPLLGGSDNINQYWNINGGNAAWTDFSMAGENPSSSSPDNLS